MSRKPFSCNRSVDRRNTFKKEHDRLRLLKSNLKLVENRLTGLMEREKRLSVLKQIFFPSIKYPIQLSEKWHPLINSLRQIYDRSNHLYLSNDCLDLKYYRLSEFSPEFADIAQHFIGTSKPFMHIDFIERIENPYLMAAFLLKEYELTQRYNRKPATRILFHGTKNANIYNISTHNFDWRLYGQNRGHKFGKGVSFSPISYYASHYGDHNSYYKVILVCLVLEGASTVGDKDTVIPPEGFDTTSKKNGHVVVKYEDNEFYPLYKILYHFDRQFDNGLFYNDHWRKESLYLQF